MEADIASQALGLGTNTDFSLMSLFLRADVVCKICDYYINRLFNLLMGRNY